MDNSLRPEHLTRNGSVVTHTWVSVAVQVARLKAAGAIILGKGNMGEWAFSPVVSISSVAGIVRNPYDLDRTPAGSSGGPAAGRVGDLVPSEHG